MDRALAVFSGVLFFSTAAAVWAFLPLWLGFLFIPGLIWLGWLLIAEGIRAPAPHTDIPSRPLTQEIGQPDPQPKDARKLAA